MTEFPKIELEDVADIMCMPVEELDKVPYEERFWICGIDNCVHWTKIRDYGLHPVYYWRPHKCWINIMEVFMYCGSCNKKYKLKLRFRFNMPVNVKTYKMWPVTKEELPHMISSKIKTQLNENKVPR